MTMYNDYFEHQKKYQKKFGEKAIVLITHYQRLLDYIKPTFVHVMRNGKIIKTGDFSLAQELELIDEFKHMINKPSPEMPDTLSVDYTQFIPYLIKSIQELNQRIVELEKKINVD